MSPPRVLLVEDLDAAGATPADTRERAHALRAAGLVVRAMALGGQSGTTRTTDQRRAAHAVAHWPAPDAECDAFLDRAHAAPFDLVLLAAAVPGGGRAARRLPRHAHTLWWPTGFGAAPSWRERFASLRRAIGSLGDGALRGPAGGGSDPASSRLAAAPLQWHARESREPPRPLPLWDGEYVLAPAGLRGRSGAAALAAFAEVASERSELDLVVLADPDAGLEGLARRAGVGARVHCVGRATREAEWAWWRQASAAMLPGDVRCSAGLVLRGLEAGCPFVVLDGSGSLPAASAAGAWLAAHRSVAAVAPDAAALAAGLEVALERGPSMQQVVASGRALAARHDPESLTRRLIARLAPELGAAWRPERAVASRRPAARGGARPVDGSAAA